MKLPGTSIWNIKVKNNLSLEIMKCIFSFNAFSDSLRNSTTLLKLLTQNSIGPNIWTIVSAEIRNGKSSKESKKKSRE